MPLTAEFLDGIEQFKAIENFGELRDKILAEHESELTGLKRNNLDLVNERKTWDQEKLTFADEKKKLEASIKDLDGKLKAGLPDEQRKHYEAKLETAENNFISLNAERDKQLAEKDAKITELLNEKHKTICMAAFNDLANADASIFPDVKEILRIAFFEKHKYQEVAIPGEGIKLLNDATSKSMKDDFAEFMKINGKRFRENTNNGGGSPGSSGVKPGQNLITRAQLDAMSNAQKTEYFDKGGRLVS